MAITAKLNGSLITTVEAECYTVAGNFQALDTGGKVIAEKTVVVTGDMHENTDIPAGIKAKIKAVTDEWLKNLAAAAKLSNAITKLGAEL